MVRSFLQSAHVIAMKKKNSGWKMIRKKTENKIAIITNWCSCIWSFSSAVVITRITLGNFQKEMQASFLRPLCTLLHLVRRGTSSVKMEVILLVRLRTTEANFSISGITLSLSRAVNQGFGSSNVQEKHKIRLVKHLMQYLVLSSLNLTVPTAQNQCEILCVQLCSWS